MASLARVVTVDPTGHLAQIVRAAIDLSAQPVIQIDVPDGREALAELDGRTCRLLITELRLNDGEHGLDLAYAVREMSPDTAVIVLAAPDAPAELETQARSAAFTYLRRPLDPMQFMRVFQAGLNGDDLNTVASAPVAQVVNDSPVDLGPIPPMDLRATERVIDALLTDVGALEIILANRAGEILLERGAVGYLNRDELANALLPMVKSNFEVGQLVGGKPSALHFYDGDTFDIFVLSVGFHHFVCLVFDGQLGSRQFGAVNRFGRRAAEDLITILGISAYSVVTPEEDEVEPHAYDEVDEVIEEAAVEPLIERAEEWATVEPELLPEPEPVMLDPIEDLDLTLFDNTTLENLDFDAADDLFDPEKLAQIANETRRERGPLSYEEARELGIIP